MSDDGPKRMIEPVGRMTARDALVYAAGEIHGNCSVVYKSKRHGGMITFMCACKTRYTICATAAIVAALRNIVEDKTL